MSKSHNFLLDLLFACFSDTPRFGERSAPPGRPFYHVTFRHIADSPHTFYNLDNIVGLRDLFEIVKNQSIP